MIYRKVNLWQNKHKTERARTVQPESEKDRGELIYFHKYLKEGYKEDGARLFPVVLGDTTKCNGHKRKHKSFPLNTRKHFSL